MTLTQDDLQAIQALVQTTVKSVVDEALEDSDQRTAAGFAEVHEKFSKVDEQFAAVDEKFTRVDERFVVMDAKLDGLDIRFDTVHADLNRMENKLNPTIEQLGDHEARLKILEPSPA